MTRALSLHQPWASLVALGVKSIETRSWPTKYRGPLLIHAAKKLPAANVVIGDRFLHRHHDHTWHLHRAEYGGLAYCAAADDPALPLGAVVASATLTDCVPIDDLGWTSIWKGWAWQGHGGAVERFAAPSGLGRGPSGGRRTVVNIDERPIGDFSAGRWAWLLDDVKPTTERCPRCWGRGYHESGPDVRVRNVECDVCDIEGACEPVPMRGHQRLWTPTWEAA